MENIVKFLPTHCSINWSDFDAMLSRLECPFFPRAEFCERCDGFFPVCPRPDMRPIHDVDLIGHYVSDYMHSLNVQRQQDNIKSVL